MITSNDHSVKFTMPAQKEAISDTLNEITAEIAKIDPEIPDLDFCLEMAVREMLANAIEHGCKNSEQKIEITLQVNTNRVKLSVRDPGKGFNCEKINMAEMPGLEEKGRGLTMIKQAVDEMHFNETGNKITVYFKST